MQLSRVTLAELVHRHGGELVSFNADEGAAAATGAALGADKTVASLESIATAGAHSLAPLLSGKYLREATAAMTRGATLLVTPDLATRAELRAAGHPIWIHPHASWVLAELLDTTTDESPPPVLGRGTTLGPNVVLYNGVVLGDRVRIEAGTVIGSPGFGWVTGPDGTMRAMPQRSGVVIEDDVRIGPLCTIDAGTLFPTRIRRGAKLDAQIHVGHNVDIGEGSIVAAQSGFAGSSVVGRGVLIGGQVGVGDHVRIGDGARIAGKSGVIGDVPAGSVVAGYPAVPRARWLRDLATVHRQTRPKARTRQTPT